MWNPDEKKNLLSKESLKSMQPMAPIRVMTDEEVFRHLFMESEMVRSKFGFTKKEGKIELVDRSWIDTTCDLDKKEWIRKIWKEMNS